MAQTKVQLLQPDLGDVIDFDASTLFVDGADNRIGIRNTNPQYELDVTGTINATNFRGNISVGTIDDWITHTGDTDTKIGFSAADTFEIHAGGGPRVVVTSTETTSNLPVAIKKTGANAKITLSRNESVASNDAAVGVIDFANNTGNTVNSRIFAKTAGTSNVGGDLTVETRADGGSLTEKFRITGTGQLRVQTTYDGNSTTSNDFPVLNINNLQGSYTADRILGGVTFGNVPGHANGIRAGMMSHYAATGNSSGNVGTYLSFRTSANASGDSSERLRIHADGEVEIKPAAAGQTTLSVQALWAVGQRVNIATFGRNGNDVKSAITYNHGTNRIEFGTTTNHALGFVTNNTEAVVIDAGQNVIVGGTSFGAASSFSMAHGGQFRSVLAQNTAGTSLIGAISGVSNGFEINVDSSQNQNYKFHNGSANNVTINQYGQVLIKTTSTANAHANADDLIIGDTGSDQRSGLTIVSDTDKDGAIHFSDGTGAGQLRGQIVYGHTFGSYSDVLAIYTGGSSSMLIQEDGDVILGEIGTTRYTEGSTEAQLRVVGNADSGRPGAISLMGFGNTSNEAHARINFQQQTSGSNGQTTARIEAINRSGAEDASDLVFYTEKTGQDLKEVARMTTGGQLLINRTDTVSTNLSFDSVHLGIGSNYGPNLSYRTIGFGYRANTTSEYPASMGCQITDWAANTKADLVFATRNSTGQADVATERLRIKAVGESHFSGPVEINGGTFNASTDATLKIIASNNNDWGILVNKYTGSATEYGINVDISKNAAYAYRIRGNGSQTYTVDGAGATTHNMWADAPTGFATGGLTKYTDAVAEYHYTWVQTDQEDYYIDLTCGSYFHAEFVYTSDQSNGGHLVEQYARGKWANNHTTHTGFLYEWSGGGGNLVTTFTASDQSGNGSVDLKGGLTTMGSAGASYRAQYGGGHEGSGGSNNGRLRIAEDKNNVSASVGNRSLIIKVYYGAFSISKSVQ